MIFRKVALERLSSPEQLDQMVQVTDPKGWLALTGIGALLLAAIGWGVFGSIPTTSQGDGILLRQGGISDLVSNATGQVQEVLVSVGDVIEKGQPVARIQQDALLRQIADDRSKQGVLRSQYEEAVRIANQQKQLRARDLAQQRANLERSSESLEKDISLLRERLDAQQALLNDGLITRETFLTTQQSLNAKRDQLAQARLDLNGLDLKRIEADQQLDQQLQARQTAIHDLELEIGELNAKLGENVNILSPYSGRVLEVLAEPRRRGQPGHGHPQRRGALREPPGGALRPRFHGQESAAGHDRPALAEHRQAGGVRLAARQGDLGGGVPLDLPRHDPPAGQRGPGDPADGAGAADPGQRRPDPGPRDAHRLPLVLLPRAEPQDQQRHPGLRRHRGPAGPPHPPDHPQGPGGDRVVRLRRSPTVLQMEAVECGAAALAIVLAHHGRWVPLEELRVACGVSRDGSKASNVVKAARGYGLAAKGFKKEPQALRSMHLPAILHWNFNHFVVLDGFRKGRVFLNDPAAGPREVSEEELDQAFTGVVLTFEPGPEFQRQGDPPRLIPALRRRLAGSRAALAFVLLAGLALAIPGLVVPVFSKIFVDSVLLENRRDWLPPCSSPWGPPRC